MKTLYYLSWHPSIATVCTRCFTNAEERTAFYNRVKDIPRANCKQWEYSFKEEA